MNKRNIIIILFLLTFISFTILAIVAIIDGSGSYDVTIKRPCIDRLGYEFENELCIEEIHCGRIFSYLDKRCSKNTEETK